MAITKRIIKTGGFAIKVGWSFGGAVDRFPSGGDDMPHYKFNIRIYAKDGKTGITVPWYDSYNNYIASKETVKDSELPSIVEYAIKDGLDGVQYSFEDFCAEMGYEEDSRKAEKVYNACKKLGEKLLTLYDEQELTDMLNALSDIDNGDAKAVIEVA